MEKRNELSEKAQKHEMLAQAAVKEAIENLKRNGCPIACYDIERQQCYMEYPDGRRENNPE